jgi:Lon protease-like protein
MTALPMFPLGGVLFPYAYLRLHVFEERYRALVRDCLGGDHRFGVVLIERGSEVGGGEVRTGVGAVARIVDAVEFDDGRWGLAAVGEGRRLVVNHWLDDAPYPLADVELLTDPPWDDQADAAFAAAETAVFRSIELRGGDAVHLDEDRAKAQWQLAQLSPLGAYDRRWVLATDDPAQRLRRLADLTDEANEVLARRPGGG